MEKRFYDDPEIKKPLIPKPTFKTLLFPALRGGAIGILITFVLQLLPLLVALGVIVLMCVAGLIWVVRQMLQTRRFEAEHARRMAELDRMMIEHLADLKRMH